MQGSSANNPDVQLIDFEYSQHSYSTFDIANHFCEYAGFECDYSRFPDDNHIAYFMLHYLFGHTANSAVRVGLILSSCLCAKLHC